MHAYGYARRQGIVIRGTLALYYVLYSICIYYALIQSVLSELGGGGGGSLWALFHNLRLLKHTHEETELLTACEWVDGTC